MTETAEKKSVSLKVISNVIPLVVSVGLCYVLFKHIDFSEMAEIVRRDCRPEWICAALALSIVSHVARAARWGIQLRALGMRCSLWELTLSIFGTYAANLVVPRIGELWRTGFVARRHGAPFMQVFGSMVADRLSDSVTVLALTCAAVVLASGHVSEYIMSGSAGVLMSSPWLPVSIALAGIIMLIFVARSQWRPAQKVRALLKSMWHGFAVVSTMRGRGRWLLLTAAIWGCYYIQLYLAFYAFPFTAALASGDGGATVVLVTFVMSSISMAVPSNGGIGPWQWAVIIALGSYGVGAPEAGAFANIVLGTQTLLLIALGIFTFACITITNKHQDRQE